MGVDRFSQLGGQGLIGHGEGKGVKGPPARSAKENCIAILMLQD